MSFGLWCSHVPTVLEFILEVAGMCDNCVLTDSCDVAMSHVKITELEFVFKMEFGIRLRFFLI